jgi:hypothetical protein
VTTPLGPGRYCARVPEPRTAYATILSTNYLAKALTLADTLARHHPGARLTVLVIDSADAAHLSGVQRPGVEVVGTDVLGLAHRDVLRLATIYDLVEMATAVKPLLLKALLAGAEQAAYLDTYVTSPMLELSPALEATEGGLLLTPHFLDPVPADAELTEGHLLTVGVYNLGFCAVDRRALPFLDWWWGHLEHECLWEPLSGLFVDQKWCDIGSVTFRAGAFRHRGYNVSVANLHERPIVLDDEGFGLAGQPDRLRLFHFHAFDTSRPEELSTRLASSTAHLRTEGTAIDRLCREYAAALVAHEEELPEPTAYPYSTDTRGRRLSRQLRRAWRVEERRSPERLPSPFLPEEAAAYDAWRRRALKTEARELVGDAVKSARLALPEEYGRLRDRFPGLVSRLRGKAFHADGIWK